MTIRFEGMHRDKLRIIYKSEVDGFQTDTIYDDEYCLQVYMWNTPTIEKYLNQGMFPVHSRARALFHFLTALEV